MEDMVQVAQPAITNWFVPDRSNLRFAVVSSVVSSECQVSTLRSGSSQYGLLHSC
jgi:hypothetical protein